MVANIIHFVPRDPAEAEKRLLDHKISELDALLDEADFSAPDEDSQFRTSENFSAPELVSKWEDLLKELNIPDIFLENEKQDYEGPYRLILEVNETMARDCLINNFKYIMALGTPEERRDYIYAHKNLLLYVRRMKSFVNNNPK